MKNFIYILLFITSTSLFSQPITWQKVLPNTYYRSAHSVIQTFNGDYLVLSETHTPQGTTITRLNQNGNIVWDRFYGVSTFNDICELGDSNFVTVGTSLYASVLIINLNGDSLWYNEYGPCTDEFNRVKKFDNNSFIACGDGGNCYGSYVSRILNTGTHLWTTFSDSLNSYHKLNDLYIDQNNIITAIGVTGTGVSTNDILFIRMNSLGSIFKKEVIITPNGGEHTKRIEYKNPTLFFISGYYDNPLPKSFLYKIDTSGVLIDKKYYDEPAIILLCKMNGLNYMMAGANALTGTQYYAALRKIDSTGNKIWLQQINYAPSVSFAYDIKLSNDGGFILAGVYFDTISNFSYTYIIKTDSNGYSNPPNRIVQVSNIIPKENKLLQNYPNPFNPVTVISYQIVVSSFVTLKIFDILGKEVEILINKNLKPGKYSIDWSPKNIPSGIYFCTMYVNDNIIDTKKMLMIK